MHTFSCTYSYCTKQETQSLGGDLCMIEAMLLAYHSLP